ncbi:MAG: hypothetical protein ACJ8AT_19290 [Hyalangium sp.]|uniref:hypothetical protein n=1 Tax=Hyalangium sp. TaxID=2028555 RepID=UPI00389ABB51
MKNCSIAFLALAGLTAASALSCASQSAATTTPAESHNATEAPANPSTATAAPTNPGGGPPPPGAEHQGPPPGGQEPVVGPPQVAWKDMTKPQRGRYMFMVVMPKMKEVFQAFDNKKFAQVTCATCHGPDARDRSFSMPNPELFALPPPEEFGPVMQKEPEWVKFMAEKVKPQMATLLGVKEYDPQNSNPQPGTFSCNNCHTVKGP